MAVQITQWTERVESGQGGGAAAERGNRPRSLSEHKQADLAFWVRLANSLVLQGRRNNVPSTLLSS